MSSTQACTKCGGTDFVKSGTKLSTEGKWQVYQCKGCGHKQRGEVLTPFHRINSAENILKKTTELNKEYLKERNQTLQTSFHNEIGAFRKLKMDNAKTSKEYLDGYIHGFKEGVEIIGGDLCDEPVEGYALADYGDDYTSHAEFIGTKECLNCETPCKDECSELGSCYCPGCSEAFEDLTNTSKEYLKGFIDGFRTALYDVGLEIGEGVLCDDPEDEYNFTDYGKNYISRAEFIKTKDCLNCEKPGKDKCSELGRLCPLICL
ncbi:MAG: hypothetical protein KKG76_10020 [Euryarchaeota archaeon]|nr:hypothetical protein [Euryarchaeota archaeon]MBU4139839.1 hypothetical protein [Euryarchaeota archaeon]